MSKPDNPKCESCFVVNNKLRCCTCKHKTEEWLKTANFFSTAMLLGDSDNYMSKEEYEQRKREFAKGENNE